MAEHGAQHAVRDAQHAALLRRRTCRCTHGPGSGGAPSPIGPTCCLHHYISCAASSVWESTHHLKALFRRRVPRGTPLSSTTPHRSRRSAPSGADRSRADTRRRCASSGWAAAPSGTPLTLALSHLVESHERQPGGGPLRQWRRWRRASRRSTARGAPWQQSWIQACRLISMRRHKLLVVPSLASGGCEQTRCEACKAIAVPLWTPISRQAPRTLLATHCGQAQRLQVEAAVYQSHRCICLSDHVGAARPAQSAFEHPADVVADAAFDVRDVCSIVHLVLAW